MRGTKTFWHVNGEFDGKRLALFRTDFADPRRIVTAYDGNYEGEPLDGLGIPAGVREKFEGHFGVVNPKPVDKSNGLPDVGGESICAARPVNASGSLPPVPASPRTHDTRWKVQFADAATGKPVMHLRATVHSRTTDGSRITHVTRIVSDGTFERNLNSDEYAWVSVVDDALTNADDAPRFFGNVPDDVKAEERHTNAAAPFVVKVKPREEEAIVKFPDEEYAKDGFPLEELNGEGVMWNGEEDGCRLGYRITGDEWRISRQGIEGRAGG